MQADRSEKLITLGVDVGGTTTKLGLFRDGKMLAKHFFPTGKEKDGGVLGVVADKIREVMSRSSISLSEIDGVGMGIPGPVTGDGFVMECPNIDLKNVQLDDSFREVMPELDVPVRAGNNANAAALGEMVRGAGRGHQDIMMVTIGTGLGAGIISNGRIVTGYKGYAGEIGHLIVNEKETEPCGCGHCGCLEQYTAGPGIVRAAQKLLKDHPEIPSPLRSFSGGGAEEDLTLPVGIVPPEMTAKDVFAAAFNGDEIAELVTTRACVMLGKALAAASFCSAPEIIILGGQISRAGAAMLDSVRGSFRRYVHPDLAEIPICLASLGGNAALIGCNYMIEQFLKEN